MFTDRLLIYTSLFVLSLHVCVISWFVRGSQPQSFTRPKEKFVVKTVALRPPEKQEKKPPPKTNRAAAATPRKQPEKKRITPPKTKNSPPKKPAAKKPPAPRESKDAQKPKREPTKKEKLLQKAKENLAKLQEDRATLSASKTKDSEPDEVGVIESLNIDRMETADPEESAYYSILAGRLKETLRLPETGSVRIRLTLDRKGNVANMETVSSKSEYNKKFIEATVKKVRFPPFGKFFSGEETHVFTITLENER